MKVILVILSSFVLFNSGISQQIQIPQKPVLVVSPNHDPQYLQKHDRIAVQSFYQSKENWQAIIDSTWGPGVSTDLKLGVFDSYTQTLDSEFDGFQSLGLNPSSWDSLKKGSEPGDGSFNTQAVVAEAASNRFRYFRLMVHEEPKILPRAAAFEGEKGQPRALGGMIRYGLACCCFIQSMTFHQTPA